MVKLELTDFEKTVNEERILNALSECRSLLRVVKQANPSLWNGYQEELLISSEAQFIYGILLATELYLQDLAVDRKLARLRRKEQNEG